MGRPAKCRRICCRPAVALFKPQSTAMQELEEVCLHPDELEAVCLADFEGLYHEEAALRMGVSRQTFGRIVSLARKKIASALLDGKALRVATGDRWFFEVNAADQAGPEPRNDRTAPMLNM